MTKKTKMYMIVIAAFLVLFIPFRALPSLMPMRSKSMNTSINPGDYDVLTIKSEQASVRLVPAGGASAEIRLTGSSNRGYKIDVSPRGSEMTVEVKQRVASWLNIGMRTRNLVLEVYLPENFSGEMKVRTVSGGIQAEGITIPSVDLSAVSGRIRAEGVQAQELQVKSVSGAVSVSGSTASRYSVQSTSGAVSLSDASGEVTLKSVSGAIAAALPRVTGPVEASSVSGAIQVSLPSNSDITAVLASRTGSVRSTHPLQGQESASGSLRGTLGNGTHEVKISSTSGAVSIR